MTVHFEEVCDLDASSRKEMGMGVSTIGTLLLGGFSKQHWVHVPADEMILLIIVAYQTYLF